MAAMSDVLERHFLNHLTGNAAYNPASTVYLGLSSSAGGFGDDNAGTEVTTTGTGYARQSIAFAAAGTSSIQNSNLVDFGRATASYGTVHGWGIFDASVNGTLLYHGAFGNPRSHPANNGFEIPAGAIVISKSAAMQTYAFQKWADMTLRNISWSTPTVLYMALDRADLSNTVEEPPWHDHSTGTIPSTTGRSYPFNFGSQTATGGKNDSIAAVNEATVAGIINGAGETYGGYNRVEVQFNTTINATGATLSKSVTRDVGFWDNSSPTKNAAWDATNSRWTNWGKTVYRNYTDRVEFPIVHTGNFGVIGGQSGAGNITTNTDGSGTVITQEAAFVNNGAGLQDGGGDSYYSSTHTTYIESGNNAASTANAIYYRAATATATGYGYYVGATFVGTHTYYQHPSSTKNYGKLKGWALYDAQSPNTGNLLMRGSFSSPITADDSDDVVRIPASNVTLLAA